MLDIMAKAFYNQDDEQVESVLRRLKECGVDLEVIK